MKDLRRWGGGVERQEAPGGPKKGHGRTRQAQPDIQDVTSTSPPVPVDKSILPTGVPYGLTCGGVVDGEDDTSAQAHALRVDDIGADQSCNGGVHGGALLLEDGSGRHDTALGAGLSCPSLLTWACLAGWHLLGNGDR